MKKNIFKLMFSSPDYDIFQNDDLTLVAPERDMTKMEIYQNDKFVGRVDRWHYVDAETVMLVY